jgi:hypothetical protein
LLLTHTDRLAAADYQAVTAVLAEPLSSKVFLTSLTKDKRADCEQLAALLQLLLLPVRGPRQQGHPLLVVIHGRLKFKML